MFPMNYNDEKARFFARTMHTPDDEARAALRAALREVSGLLIPLHRALIDAAKEDYAFAFGPVVQPTQLLRLLNEDAFFAWLKPITSLIVDIDEMARRDFEAVEVESIARRIEWIRQGIFAGSDRKGAQVLMEGPRLSAKPRPESSLDVELTSEGGVKVNTPGTNAPPATNSPAK